MRIGMLGPLELRADDGTPVEVGGARLRAALIVLALSPGQVVPMARLVDGVWGERPPAGAVNAVQALVSRLRRALPSLAIESHPAGYFLAVEPDAVDVVRFERLAAAGRSAAAGDPAGGARILREALALWRGPALVDVAGADFFAAPVARLSELRLSVLEDRVEADLRVPSLDGAGAALVVELTSLVAEHPLRERLAGALMRALCATGRRAEALAVYERARRALAENLGTDPSPELSALHTAILRGEVAAAPGAPAAADVAAGAPGAAVRTNLRVPLTGLVGRENDLKRVGDLLDGHRLATLTGPGGSGKTRLAGEAAHAFLDRRPGGVWLVELAPVREAAEVPRAVLAALRIGEQAWGGPVPEGDPADRLVAALRTRDLLLVLDNCEHLADAVAALADRLLGECPQLRILATSREPLGLTGEALWPVEPLALPPEDAGAAEAMRYPAVRLLGERARAANPGFEVNKGTAAAVVRICRALDGMPLAIELAAARLRTMTAERLAERLGDRFRLLTGGSRVALPRHRTLRAVVDWSWDLLSDEERALLRRLAVFSGGATPEAAEQVSADGGTTPEAAEQVRADDGATPDAAERVRADGGLVTGRAVGEAGGGERVLGLLFGLADKSLLVVSDDEGPRFGMLETIREYALERLREAGELERVRRAHAAWFAAFAEAADPRLRRAGQAVWLRRLAAERANVDAAVRDALAARDHATAVRLVAAMGWCWFLDWSLSGHKAEGARLAAEVLAMPGLGLPYEGPVEGAVEGVSEGAADGRVVAAACAVAALFELNGHGDERRAGEWIRAAEGIAARTWCPHPLARLIGPLSRMPADSGALEAGALEGLFADEDPWVRAMARMNQALTWIEAGRRHGEAEAALESALAGFRAIGERWGVSSALTALGGLASWRGDLEGAAGRYEEAIAVVTEVVPGEDVWQMRLKLAHLRWLGGDADGCAAALARAERDTERIGLPDGRVAVAYTRAELARWAGDHGAARAYLGRAEDLARGIPVSWGFRAMVLDSLAYLDALAGDLESARAHRAAALPWALRSMSAPAVGLLLVGVADLALRRGRPREAARLLGASRAVRGTPDLSQPDAARVEAAVRDALGDAGYAEAERGGRDATIATVRELVAPTLTP
ncbi:winged helix-turn-helix domain-containing protein [Nonomuraea sp. 3-1Str]|uniref:BTAD domain-containing putative transcriptional regulator n=1 Tax=Nonomuraea sp. 3-1Str TaxID=2929801 RepID=UPI00285B5C6D|nr:BTAD domain-containing putative transcriptional regulator [Nonomuraea sp. 3-1Str]MDR8413988.1 winged helix-turn-helix domain-containing protein [Nonomuraea sp. 3-1Str]